MTSVARERAIICLSRRDAFERVVPECTKVHRRTLFSRFTRSSFSLRALPRDFHYLRHIFTLTLMRVNTACRAVERSEKQRNTARSSLI